MKPSKHDSFPQRLFMGLITFSLVLTFIVFSHHPSLRPLFAAFVGGTIAVALWELYALMEKLSYAPAKKIGVCFSLILTGAVFIDTRLPAFNFVPSYVAIILLFILFLCFLYKGKEPIVNIALTLFGLSYLTIPLSAVISINYITDASTIGRCWILYLLMVTKITDIAAYFFGKLLGRHTLVQISPHKTWEGAIGGFVCAILSSLLFALIAPYVRPSFPLDWPTSLLLGGILSVLAQIGDLAESLLKRDAGIKDSNQIPGFGGILDLVDSLIFTTPFLYLYLKCVIG